MKKPNKPFVQKVRSNEVIDFEEELCDHVDYWHTEYHGRKGLFEFLGILPKHYSTFLHDKDFEKTIKEDPDYEQNFLARFFKRFR